MCKKCSLLMTFALMVASISPAASQVPPGVKAGMLNCVLSPTIGIVVGSLQTISCKFTPDGPYPPEAYVGTFGTLGLDIGVVAVGGLAWAVYNQTQGPLINALAGTYVGGSGEVGVGVGVGANVLFGGSNRTVALQPVSLEGEVALNAVLGVSTLILKPAY